MADRERFNLLYKPNLKPERNYRSEATFEPPEPTPVTDTNVPIEPELPEIIEDLITLEDLAGGLPDGLQPVEEIVSVLRQRAEVIQTEIELSEGIPVSVIGPEPESVIPVEDNIPDEIQIGTNITEYTPTVPGIPELFPPPSNVKINIETPKTLVQLTQDAYVKDQIDLQKHYLQNMRLILQRYFQNQFALMGELGISEMGLLTRDYHGDEIGGVGTNSQHLHDTIIRSQIARKQKAKFFSKIANTEQTLIHMRNWNAAEKLRERYYGEAYGESDTFTNSEANAILRQNRSEFDANYKSNLYNMYKYLDGSLKVTEDILDHTLLESKAKTKLVKDGVDIFAQPTYSTGSGVQTTQAQVSAETSTSNTPSTDTAATKPTTEEIDKAIGIKDPASEQIYGLAPNGAHFSQNDINYLISTNPDYYGTSGQKAKNVANTLALHSKYAAGSSDTSSSNKTTETSSNKSPEKTSEQVSGTSNQKVESVTASETEKKQTTQQKQENEAKQVKEELKKETSTFTPDPYILDYRYESGSTKKNNIIAGSGFVAIISRTGAKTATFRIVSAETASIAATGMRKAGQKIPTFEEFYNIFKQQRGDSVTSYGKTLDESSLRTVYDKLCSINLSS